MTIKQKHADAVSRAIDAGSAEAKSKLRQQRKYPVRTRLEMLLDVGSFVENGLLARHEDGELVTDAIVTGVGTIGGRNVAIIANDPMIKAGAWGRQTIRKITRQQELAAAAQFPLIYLVDSAGARLNEQFDIFIDRQHAGRIFWNQARMSGRIPQLCILFGPSPAGAAYIPAFCDIVIMVDGAASAFLGSPRMVKMATGEETTAEAMGGARMHCSTSGLGDYLAKDEDDALSTVVRYLDYLPQNWQSPVPVSEPRPPSNVADLWELIPETQSRGYDVRKVVSAVFDAGTTLELRQTYATELLCAFARIGGRAIGVLANQPMHKAGTLNSDSSDKGAHFVQMCNAYGLPLVFLCDTPGFMIGTDVEKAGIIRHGAKLLSAIASCSVPRICVVLRKAYGAGYFAMSGGGFQPDALLALPQARMGIMGPEAAINAVHLNRLTAIEDEALREVETRRLRDDYMQDLDVYRAASEFYIDAVVDPNDLREQLLRRVAQLELKSETQIQRRNPVMRG